MHIDLKLALIPFNKKLVLMPRDINNLATPNEISKRQKLVTLSSTEAEYITQAATVQELKWTTFFSVQPPYLLTTRAPWRSLLTLNSIVNRSISASNITTSGKRSPLAHTY
ncbi:hypothetical protein N7451_006592 [Penicillium sp. IBT 35674x]|nr:hypothetical protein N7451_006592 [Penicillium sp. IBT 35674x]